MHASIPFGLMFVSYDVMYYLQISAEPAGVMEDRAIEMARQRQAAESSGAGVEEMKRQSDEEATEQAAVEAALRTSREDFDNFTDLETALELSAQHEIQVGK